jgi:hypothetical protein
MAELQGDGLGRLDQGLVGSVKARGAEWLGKNPRHVGADQRGGAQDSTDVGARGRTGPTRRWLDRLVGWLV